MDRSASLSSLTHWGYSAAPSRTERLGGWGQKRTLDFLTDAKAPSEVTLLTQKDRGTEPGNSFWAPSVGAGQSWLGRAGSAGCPEQWNLPGDPRTSGWHQWPRAVSSPSGAPDRRPVMEQRAAPLPKAVRRCPPSWACLTRRPAACLGSSAPSALLLSQLPSHLWSQPRTPNPARA